MADENNWKFLTSACTCLEKLDADPSGGDLIEGRIWYNTTDKKIRYYDGTAIQTLAVEAV